MNLDTLLKTRINNMSCFYCEICESLIDSDWVEAESAKHEGKLVCLDCFIEVTETALEIENE